MKPGKLLLTATFLCILQMPVMAETETSTETEPPMTMEESTATETAKKTEPPMAVEESDTTIGNVLPEFVFRPVGVLSSAAGLGFYVASLPFAAIANLLEPHDALEFTLDTFILTPFRFTFQRPIGTYSVQIDSQ